MARIAGINIPTKIRVEIALTYIHGIGTTSARTICDKAGITQERRINDLTEDELTKLRDIIDSDHLVEGDLRRKTSMDVKRYLDLGVCAACVTAGICLYGGSARTRMLGHVKVQQRQSPVKRNKQR